MGARSARGHATAQHYRCCHSRHVCRVCHASAGHSDHARPGHGAYLAPDWSADWLHREATTLLDIFAKQTHGRSFNDLAREDQAALEARLKAEMRLNRYDEVTDTVVITDEQPSTSLQPAR